MLLRAKRGGRHQTAHAHPRRVPQLPQHEIEVDRQHSLPLKQKPAPMYRWGPGVHQHMLWVGCSRPSKDCEKNGAWFRNQFTVPPLPSSETPRREADIRQACNLGLTIGRSRGSLWSWVQGCRRARHVGHGVLACPTRSKVEPDCTEGLQCLQPQNPDFR